MRKVTLLTLLLLFNVSQPPTLPDSLMLFLMPMDFVISGTFLCKSISFFFHFFAIKHFMTWRWQSRLIWLLDACACTIHQSLLLWKLCYCRFKRVYKNDQFSPMLLYTIAGWVRHVLLFDKKNTCNCELKTSICSNIMSEVCYKFTILTHISNCFYIKQQIHDTTHNINEGIHTRLHLELNRTSFQYTRLNQS